MGVFDSSSASSLAQVNTHTHTQKHTHTHTHVSNHTLAISKRKKYEAVQVFGPVGGPLFVDHGRWSDAITGSTPPTPR